LQTLNKLESGDFLAIKLVTSLTILRRGGGWQVNNIVRTIH
jgi:hypothetical protein